MRTCVPCGAPLPSCRRLSTFTLACVLFAALACEGAREDTSDAGTSSDDAPPNVVLIVVDTLRADHLSHYGYTRPTSASLDAFRAESTLYSRAYSTAPWTGPSTISIHTGLSPLRHGANAHGDALPKDAETLAEILSDAGYFTHGISYNYEVSAKTGYERGFDVFVDYDRDVLAYPDIGFMVKRVRRFAAEPPDAPFFLYLHPMNTHGPYRVPEARQAALLGRPPSRVFEYYGEIMSAILRERDTARRADVTREMIESLVDQYDVAIQYSMEEIAKMLETLEGAGLLENTIVILTSDHGEELFDHGGFSHGYSLYEEVLRVPLYVRWPDTSGGGTRDRLVSLLDILPTVLEATGLEDDRDLDGVSLLRSDDEIREERRLVQQAGWTKRAVGHAVLRGHDHLITLERAYDAPEGRTELFDLATDPAELRDLARTDEDRVTALRDALADRAAELASKGAIAGGENVLSEMDEARLRALGYME